MAKTKPLHGPPIPNPFGYAARMRIEDSDDPVDIVIGACVLHELAKPILPVGGGLIISGARELAEDIVAALDLRGMLTRQRALF